MIDIQTSESLPILGRISDIRLYKYFDIEQERVKIEELKSKLDTVEAVYVKLMNETGVFGKTIADSTSAINNIKFITRKGAQLSSMSNDFSWADISEIDIVTYYDVINDRVRFVHKFVKDKNTKIAIDNFNELKVTNSDNLKIILIDQKLFRKIISLFKEIDYFAYMKKFYYEIIGHYYYSYSDSVVSMIKTNYGFAFHHDMLSHFLNFSRKGFEYAGFISNLNSLKKKQEEFDELCDSCGFILDKSITQATKTIFSHVDELLEDIDELNLDY